MRQGGLNPTEEQVKIAIKQVNKEGEVLNIIVKTELLLELQTYKECLTSGNNELCLEAFCELMSGKWKEEKPKEKDEMKKAFEVNTQSF